MNRLITFDSYLYGAELRRWIWSYLSIMGFQCFSDVEMRKEQQFGDYYT